MYHLTVAGNTANAGKERHNNTKTALNVFVEKTFDQLTTKGCLDLIVFASYIYCASIDFPKGFSENIPIMGNTSSESETTYNVGIFGDFERQASTTLTSTLLR